MNLSEIADQASRSCGLPKSACMALLSQGWELRQRINEPAAWVQVGLRVEQRPAVVAAQVHGLGGSVQVAIAARQSYDRDASGNNARAWLEAEDRLTGVQYLDYQRQYQAVRA